MLSKNAMNQILLAGMLGGMDFGDRKSRPKPPELATIDPNYRHKDTGQILDPKDIDVTVHKVVPPGCLHYFFNENGGYEHKRSGYTVFDTIASSKSNAYKKYHKWKENNVK